MASRFKFARVGAGLMGATAVLLMAAAVPASADPARGVVDGGQPGLNVNVGDGFKSDLSTSLIGFRLEDGNTLGMYCVEIETGIDREHPLEEKNWDNYPNSASPFNENRDKINWILHNGFPVQKVEDLTEKLTTDGASLSDGTLNAQEAIAGTQAAIWHFSDATDLDIAEAVPGNARSSVDVLALYDFLTGADNVGLEDEPNAALQIDPTEQKGEAGERIGPFKVSTTGVVEELEANLPEGVRITDLDGADLAAQDIKNAAELFLDVPEDTAAGEASFELTAKATVETGRLFVGKDYSEERKTQSLIVAGAEETQLTASAKGSWVEAQEEAPPAPQGRNDGGLAETGASILAPVIIGVVLVGAGIGSLLFLRRRRNT
jgi:TQXA domain-containing protein/LPXTG-motif cell wall-anchored protein